MSGQEYHQTFYNITHEDLYDILGFHIRDIEKYRPVFTHRSMIESQIDSYERLEFLGDSIVNFSATNFLHRNFPDVSEGDLTKMRSRMVNTKCLSLIGRKLNLDKYISITAKNKETDETGNRFINNRIIEDMFEALIGALFLDLGFVVAESFYMQMFRRHVPQYIINEDYNFKDQLMRWAQSRAMNHPVYEMISDDSTQVNCRRFEMVAIILGNKMKRGFGGTKKEASQDAAKNTLQYIKDTNNGLDIPWIEEHMNVINSE